MAAHFTKEKISVISLYDLNIQRECPETGRTLSENAVIKYHFYKDDVGEYDYIISEDSGFFIDSLPGMFRVNTKRDLYNLKNAGYEPDKYILEQLEGTKNRNASFKVSILLADSSGSFVTASATMPGFIDHFINYDIENSTQPFRKIFKLNIGGINLEELEQIKLKGVSDVKDLREQALEQAFQSLKVEFSAELVK